MCPEHLEEVSSPLDGAELAQTLNELADWANGASNANSSNATKPAVTDMEAYEKNNENSRGCRAGCRGGIKEVGKITIANTDATEADDNDNDNDDDDDEEKASNATTILLTPRSTMSQPLPIVRELSDLVPVVPHYELRPISSAAADGNSHDEGLFATADILEGTRVIWELPLISLPAFGDQVSAVWSAYLDLPKASQDTFWSLRPGVLQNMEQWSTHCDSIIPVLIEIHEKKPEDRTEHDNRLFKDLAPKIETMCSVWRAAARFLAHQYCLTDATGVPIKNIFAQISRLRHSCMPNCFCNWNPATGRMTVHAVKPIAADEELTISFISASAFYRPHSTRKSMLLKKTGLTCTCPACDPQHRDYAMHEHVRQELYVHAANLEVVLAELESINDPDRPTYNATHIYYAPDIRQLTEKRCLRVIKLLGQAGCTDVETVRWRGALTKKLLPKSGAWLAALAHAKLSLRKAEICWGKDFGELRGLEKHVKFVTGMLEQERKREKE